MLPRGCVLLANGSVALLLAGCATTGASPQPAVPPAPVAPEPQTPPPSPELGGEAAAAPVSPSEPEAASDAPSPSAGNGGSRSEASIRELCRSAARKPEESALDAARRRLQETVCGANLWLDGLFGGEPDVENARRVSGRLELSSVQTEAYGSDAKVRLRVAYDLPTLKHRLRLFLGREELDEATQDRATPLGVRSAFFDLGEREEWLAGFGYSPPGPYGSRFSLRLGVRVQSETVVYVQGRYRQNFFLSERSTFRFRETVFWRNREHGFGSTTGLDYDRLIHRDTIFRWGNVGTISQGTEGLEWRSSLLLYHNLHRGRALSGELFVRGATKSDVSVEEYGLRAIYRQPILRRGWLFGELLFGYSFPKLTLADEREGSAMIGFGVDLLFGQEPY